ncbi:hypothetical protein GCM10007971_05470 [Oceanobacillus indicireducens]|uniref:Uncharacterized protein n=1 Tax=Oceanobacillus indicireducens TaxID=1004261 RepID=A0A917XTI6_9BACI|nr:hypothetical protein GCM10007971_05470 [Oceanobacillus indicireducens]
MAETKESSSKDIISFDEFVDFDSCGDDIMSTPPNIFSFFNVFKRRKYFTLFKGRQPSDNNLPADCLPAMRKVLIINSYKDRNNHVKILL